MYKFIKKYCPGPLKEIDTKKTVVNFVDFTGNSDTWDFLEVLYESY